MEDGAAHVASQASPLGSATAASPRQQLAQQVTSGVGTDDGGSILSQLSNNPFFTAVSSVSVLLARHWP